MKIIFEVPDESREHFFACWQWMMLPERKLSSSGTLLTIRAPGRDGEPEFGWRILGMSIEEESP